MLLPEDSIPGELPGALSCSGTGGPVQLLHSVTGPNEPLKSLNFPLELLTEYVGQVNMLFSLYK